MSEAEVRQRLTELGALIVDSHIVYTSGKHGSAYVNKDAIYPHTAATSSLCEQIARHFRGRGVDVVIAPAVGGVILSQWTAHHLTGFEGHEVLGAYAEKREGGDGFIIKRGYDRLVQGRRVLVVEDILTTGGSVKKVVETVRAIGGDVVGVGALCNRGGIAATDIGGVPELFALINVSLESFDPSDCPLCRAKVPINTSVGKGKQTG
jgi:orotate phosphoribosyltransferase